VLKFRNYVPRDRDLKELKVEAPVIPALDIQESSSVAPVVDAVRNGEVCSLTHKGCLEHRS
jgi:hypothetical protein